MTGAVWFPLAAVCFVILGIIVVLSALPIFVVSWWDKLRFNRMTAEQRRAANIAREEKLPKMASKIMLKREERTPSDCTHCINPH